MKYINTAFAALLSAALVALAGCSSKPPGCSDAETLSTMKGLVMDTTAKHLSTDQRLADDPDGWMRKFYDGLKIELSGIVSEGYKADAKKQSCRGTLKVVALTGRGAFCSKSNTLTRSSWPRQRPPKIISMLIAGQAIGMERTRAADCVVPQAVRKGPIRCL